MIRAARLVAALFPLAGLAALWALSDSHYRTGTEWEVPIAGYDPRDVLRGHYVEFSYAWPGIDEIRDAPPQALCLAGKAPQLAAVSVLPAGQPCPHPVRAQGSGSYGWDALMRGRLYVGQERAGELQQALQNPDQRAIVTIRQRADGSFSPIAIRFRPLTPEEIAERDAQNERAEDSRPPPPIMAD